MTRQPIRLHVENPDRHATEPAHLGTLIDSKASACFNIGLCDETQPNCKLSITRTKKQKKEKSSIQ